MSPLLPPIGEQMAELLRRAAVEMLGAERSENPDVQRALELTGQAVARVLREPLEGDPGG